MVRNKKCWKPLTSALPLPSRDPAREGLSACSPVMHCLSRCRFTCLRFCTWLTQKSALQESPPAHFFNHGPTQSCDVQACVRTGMCRIPSPTVQSSKLIRTPKWTRTRTSSRMAGLTCSCCAASARTNLAGSKTELMSSWSLSSRSLSSKSCPHGVVAWGSQPELSVHKVLASCALCFCQHGVIGMGFNDCSQQGWTLASFGLVQAIQLLCFSCDTLRLH